MVTVKDKLAEFKHTFKQLAQIKPLAPGVHLKVIHT